MQLLGTALKNLKKINSLPVVYMTLSHEEHNQNKDFHYIEGLDKAGTRVMCIGEVVNNKIVDVLFKYLIAKYKGE